MINQIKEINNRFLCKIHKLRTELKKLPFQNPKRNIDHTRYLLDLSFYLLSAWAFWKSISLCLLMLFIFIVLPKITTRYEKNMNGFYLDQFIDFLNLINTNLSLGYGFESSITSISKDINFDHNYSSKCIHQLNNAIQIGIEREVIYQRLYSYYPISECSLYIKMIRAAKVSGANLNRITDVTLDKLHMKYKVKNEVKTILYQKVLEQNILSLAPIFIILFIDNTSRGYLDIMYTTIVGRITMTFAFILIFIMNLVAKRIVNFEV
ncbi:MAG: hypothetical protein BGO41_13505 [Clostridiales bacterium 38-18]|nr:MAG: hypothetical protein BGO41_13505 [Clostridiales bacterium 38-18]